MAGIAIVTRLGLCRALLSLLDTCLQLDLVKHHYCAVTRRTQLQGHNQTQDQDTKVDDTYCALLLGPRPGAKEGEALSELLQQHKQVRRLPAAGWPSVTVEKHSLQEWSTSCAFLRALLHQVVQ